MLRNRVEFHDQAGAEYDAAFDWYLERSPDAALRFDAEVSRALKLITRSPGRWALGSHDTRRFLLRQFPFILVYRELSDGHIQVLAVAHEQETRVLEESSLAAVLKVQTMPFLNSSSGYFVPRQTIPSLQSVRNMERSKV